MGQKVSPIGLRVGVIRDWDAKWYAPKQKVADLLHEDLKIRKFINDFYKSAYGSQIEIKRTGKRVIVVVHAAKPGIVIGAGGARKNVAVKELNKLTGKNVFLTVVEIKQIDADKDAALVARKWLKILKTELHSDVFKKWQFKKL